MCRSILLRAVVGAIVAAWVAGCATDRLDAAPPGGVNLTGDWKLNLNLSDDPDKIGPDPDATTPQRAPGSHRGHGGGRGGPGGGGGMGMPPMGTSPEDGPTASTGSYDPRSSYAQSSSGNGQFSDYAQLGGHEQHGSNTPPGGYRPAGSGYAQTSGGNGQFSDYAQLGGHEQLGSYTQPDGYPPSSSGHAQLSGGHEQPSGYDQRGSRDPLSSAYAQTSRYAQAGYGFLPTGFEQSPPPSAGSSNSTTSGTTGGKPSRGASINRLLRAPLTMSITQDKGSLTVKSNLPDGTETSDTYTAGAKTTIPFGKEGTADRTAGWRGPVFVVTTTAKKFGSREDDFAIDADDGRLIMTTLTKGGKLGKVEITRVYDRVKP